MTQISIYFFDSRREDFRIFEIPVSSNTALLDEILKKEEDKVGKSKKTDYFQVYTETGEEDFYFTIQDSTNISEKITNFVSKIILEHDQIIQPWMFGHGETKATCLWLTNLPKLKPTDVVEGREGRVWKETPSPNRWKNRSRTYQGIADAMANQWG